MATHETLTPSKYGFGTPGSTGSTAFEGWYPYTAGNYIDVESPTGLDLGRTTSFLVTRSHPEITFRSVFVQFHVRNLPTGTDISVYAYASDWSEERSTDIYIGSTTVTSSSSSQSLTASLLSSGKIFDSSKISVVIYPSKPCQLCVDRIDAYYSPITIGVSPDPVFADQPATISFGNRLDEQMEVTFKKQTGTQVFDTITVNEDEIEYTCPESWFDGSSASTYTLAISINAQSDRGSSIKSFKLKKPKPNTVTITSPTSGTFDVASEITFEWSSTGDGTQTKAKLEWSTDQTTWTTFGEVNDATESFKAPKGTFKFNGRIYWRVSVYNTLETWSAPAQASINITLTPATVTLTSPTSGSWSGSSALTFAWSINQGSGVMADVNGTQLQVSTDDGVTWETMLNRTSAVTRWVSEAAQFPPGRLRWRVRAKNKWQTGWLENWAAASITIAYSAVSQIVVVNSTTSGRIPASAPQAFSITLEASEPVYSPFTISSASFFWRSGTSGEFTETAMTASGADASVTIPGGTFPSGIIQWYASAVDNTGATRETEVYTLQALNAVVEAVPLSPIDTIEGVSSEITFTWLYASLDGSAQSRALLEYSRDGETWETLADVSGADTSYTAPAGFFVGGGTVYWRVQAFNASGTAGPKSDVVSFILFGSSSVSSVIGDGKPFATISWQAEGQVSWELQIGELHIGPYFGAYVRSYTHEEPLPDGIYTVRVRIQNKYGIWSEWAETVMSVTNVSLGDVWFTFPEGRNEYDISWETSGISNAVRYYLYRNKALIASTPHTAIEDRVAAQTNQYTVYVRRADNYYTKSSPRDGVISISVPQLSIGRLDGGDFIELRLSADAERTLDYRMARETVYTSYSGAVYPSAEIGEHKSLSISFDVAFLEEDYLSNEFEALLGEDVIVKPRNGMRAQPVIGVLDALELKEPRFYKSYRCTVQRMEWRDFVYVP